jgi:hypothetical protein
MNLSLHQKRGLYWWLGILMAAVLTSVAWSQICSVLAHCSSMF